EQYASKMLIELGHRIRHAIADCDRGDGCVRVRGYGPTLGGEWWLAKIWPHRPPPLGNSPEMLLDELDRLVDVQVAGHREDGIGGGGGAGGKKPRGPLPRPFPHG